MNIRLLLSALHIIVKVSAQSAEPEFCPVTPPAPDPAPDPFPQSTESFSTTIVIDLPGSTSDWGGVLEQLRIFLKQLSQVRRLIGTKHFLSELLTTLRVPGAKEHWIKLFEDISLEDIFDEFVFAGQ